MLIDTGKARVPVRPAGIRRRRRSASSRFAPLVLIATVVFLLGGLEIQTSWLQSRLFTSWARRSTFSVEPGPTPHFRYPHSGPYDIRLGHSLLGGYLKRLEEAGFEIQSQARVSPWTARLMDWGLTPSFDEKTQAGLQITDRRGRTLYRAAYPERVYHDFESIPPLVVETLRFIENREVLQTRYPRKNPAIEWDRLAHAAIGWTISRFRPQTAVTGGSTLITQTEKFRHSPGGRTGSPAEKLRQMVSASMHAYSDGPETAAARRRIVVDYLNSIPLAAVPGYGEVYGLGDGLWCWFGTDFDTANRLLNSTRASADRARIYRQVLSLLLAIKKPTAYLVRDREALSHRVDAYLRLLAREGIVSPDLRDRALSLRPAFRRRAEVTRPGSYSSRKATDSVRIDLLQTLHAGSAYDLDRLDLSVESTLDGPAQRTVSWFLDQIRHPAFAAQAGLLQHRLLARGDPAGVIYSLTLYERGNGVNYLRVQADNLNQPLNMNEGTKLELGSTAKLRTLASYLEAIARLHRELTSMDSLERNAMPIAPSDRLTAWARDWLAAHPGASLPQMLDAAMSRLYPACPRESFFTGSGLHHFSNFDADDNERVLTVREAFQRSVNLVFIRLMRDLINHYTYRINGVPPDLLANPRNPERRDYLARFAEREGHHLLTHYYQKYQGLNADEAITLLATGMNRKTPRRLATICRLLRPNDGLNGFAACVIGGTLNPDLSDDLLESLYREHAPGRLSLTDRAFIAGVDPLELWLVDFRLKNPSAGLGEVFRQGEPYCQVAYRWLFRKQNRRAQDRAIRIMLEVDAFRELHRDWVRQGYPFGWLVPSLATALGSSGDTPAALAQLVGIIANDGVFYPGIRVERLHFASDTPYETNLAFRPKPGERILEPEVAALLRRELVGVVQQGTGRRAHGAILLGDGMQVTVGGKTGTGDNRWERYGVGGRVIESRVINRTATFVFMVGERYFGAITAFVPGETAAQYGFTSSLPVQIFRQLAPALEAILSDKEPSPALFAALQRPASSNVIEDSAENLR